MFNGFLDGGCGKLRAGSLCHVKVFRESVGFWGLCLIMAHEGIGVLYASAGDMNFSEKFWKDSRKLDLCYVCLESVVA